MKVHVCLQKIPCSIAAALLILAGSSPAVIAQQPHHSAVRGVEQTQDQKARAGALVGAVREATERYKDVAAAEADGYNLMFGCVSGPDYGAMGLHHVKLPLVGDGQIDVARPEIVIYEPLPNGRVKLVGADYLVYAADWHAKNGAATPQIMGQLMHLIESPNRYGLPAFYTLHVWAWKESATGPFVNWHPTVSCKHFAGQAK